MRALAGAAAGSIATSVIRLAVRRGLEARLHRDVQALNAGDYQRLLSNYADHSVLWFPDGDHRWAGEHRGKAAIERFLREFTAAGLRGEVRELLVSGPLWRMSAVVRFDDRALSPDGQELLYRNRAVLLIRTRWGRIVEHEDFFEDTRRMETLEARLAALGLHPMP